MWKRLRKKTEISYAEFYGSSCPAIVYVLYGAFLVVVALLSITLLLVWLLG